MNIIDGTRESPCFPGAQSADRKVWGAGKQDIVV